MSHVIEILGYILGVITGLVGAVVWMEIIATARTTVAAFGAVLAAAFCWICAVANIFTLIMVTLGAK